MLRAFRGLVLGTLLAVLGAGITSGQTPGPTAGELLVSGLQGTIGSTIGLDGALYVPEGATGEITRVDPDTGATSTFAEGLPPAPFGGAIDVAFVDGTLYALVTLVEVSGIYELGDNGDFTVLADLGAFSATNLPPYPVDVPTGLQYAMEPFEEGFIVTDGHHNRVLQAGMDGEVGELISFGNVVPTGLALAGDTVYMSEIGAIPHVPADGRVVKFDLSNPRTEAVASGISLIVDVEWGPDGRLYALSQGDSPGEVPPASPAMPDSGKVLRVDGDGTFSVLVDDLDLPTSLEFVGDDAVIVTLNGEVWRVDGLPSLSAGPSSPPAVSPPSAGTGGLLGERSMTPITLVLVATTALGIVALMTRRPAS